MKLKIISQCFLFLIFLFSCTPIKTKMVSVENGITKEKFIKKPEKEFENGYIHNVFLELEFAMRILPDYGEFFNLKCDGTYSYTQFSGWADYSEPLDYGTYFIKNNHIYLHSQKGEVKESINDLEIYVFKINNTSSSSCIPDTEMKFCISFKNKM